MSAEAQQSQSDINWSTSERPVLSAIAAGVGALGGYVGGLQALLWWVHQPLMPLREIPGDIFHLLLRYGPILPVSGGWGPAACAAVAAVALGVGMWRLTTRENERHMRGIRLRRNPKEAARALAPGRGEAPGIALHPMVRISEHQECRAILIAGGAGSGKTTIIVPLLHDVIARGDRCLVFDFKGDFTQCLPGPLTLLSPTDRRGARWIVGRDVATRLEGEALAETLVPLPASGEPIWARGARGLLTGLISHLQTQKPNAWDFADLAQIASQTLTNYKLLVEIVEREHPPAKAYLMGRDSKQTASFLAELAGCLSHAINLGVASAAADPKSGTWSVRGWLSGKTKLPRTVILGFRPSSRDLSRAFISSVIEQVVRQISNMPDCAPSERRVWLMLDEVPQCGHIPSITDALETLRSKGVRTVLGLQSFAQVERIYDRHTATEWLANTATKIVCSVSAPADQKVASSLLGDREVERYSGQAQIAPGAGAASRSHAWQRAREPVMQSSEFGTHLSVNLRKRTVRALLLAGGEASILDWPFFNKQKRRPDRVDAEWVKIGYKRPRWGAVPPPVAAPPDDDEADPAAPAQAKKPPEAQQQAKPVPQAAAKTQVQVTPGQAQKPSPKREAESPDPIGDMAGSTLLDAVIPGAGIVSDLARQILDAAGMSEATAPAAPMPEEFPERPTSEEPENQLEVNDEHEI